MQMPFGSFHDRQHGTTGAMEMHAGGPRGAVWPNNMAATFASPRLGSYFLAGGFHWCAGGVSASHARDPTDENV